MNVTSNENVGERKKRCDKQGGAGTEQRKAVHYGYAFYILTLPLGQGFIM